MGTAFSGAELASLQNRPSPAGRRAVRPSAARQDFAAPYNFSGRENPEDRLIRR